jgi:hypothetical protein
MVEYMIIPATDTDFKYADALTERLNKLAQEDWAVVTNCQTGLILERLVPDLAENILRKSYTYSYLDCVGWCCKGDEP